MHLGQDTANATALPLTLYETTRATAAHPNETPASTLAPIPYHIRMEASERVALAHVMTHSRYAVPPVDATPQASLAYRRRRSGGDGRGTGTIAATRDSQADGTDETRASLASLDRTLRMLHPHLGRLARGLQERYGTRGDAMPATLARALRSLLSYAPARVTATGAPPSTARTTSGTLCKVRTPSPTACAS